MIAVKIVIGIVASIIVSCILTAIFTADKKNKKKANNFNPYDLNYVARAKKVWKKK